MREKLCEMVWLGEAEDVALVEIEVVAEGDLLLVALTEADPVGDQETVRVGD